MRRGRVPGHSRAGLSSDAADPPFYGGAGRDLCHHGGLYADHVSGGALHLLLQCHRGGNEERGRLQDAAQVPDVLGNPQRCAGPDLPGTSGIRDRVQRGHDDGRGGGLRGACGLLYGDQGACAEPLWEPVECGRRYFGGYSQVRTAERAAADHSARVQGPHPGAGKRAGSQQHRGLQRGDQSGRFRLHSRAGDRRVDLDVRGAEPGRGPKGPDPAGLQGRRHAGTDVLRGHLRGGAIPAKAHREHVRDGDRRGRSGAPGKRVPARDGVLLSVAGSDQRRAGIFQRNGKDVHHRDLHVRAGLDPHREHDDPGAPDGDRRNRLFLHDRVVGHAFL